jgi:hypothetical protein
MQLDLAEQLVRQKTAVAIQDRGGTLIAGRFDRQDAHNGAQLGWGGLKRR